MKTATIISVILAVGLAITSWLLYDSMTSAKGQIEELTSSKDDLLVRVNNLEQQKGALEQELRERMVTMSREKEEELARVQATYDTLVNDLKAEIEQGQVTITQLADRLSVSMVDRILFPSGEAAITPEGVKVLERVGNVLKNTQRKVIRVEGHTDNIPISQKLEATFPTNWELSAARATNVVRFLQEKVGIAPDRLEAVGLSEFHPVATNTTPAGRSQNRRIEISLLPETSIVPQESAAAEKKDE
jgi:chemotaxis protein MotB